MTETFGPHPETIKSVYNFAPTALEELALWLETRGLRQSLSSMLGSGDIVRTSTSVYAAYTPTWTASGTAPAIGNSTVTARYIKIGKFVHAYGKIGFGSSATFGTGTYSFALPATATAAIATTGIATMFDSSTLNFGTGRVVVATTTTMQIEFGATYFGTYSGMAQTTPWTWATSDEVSWSLNYEAA